MEMRSIMTETFSLMEAQRNAYKYSFPTPLKGV